MDIPDILGQENVTKYAKWRPVTPVTRDVERRGIGKVAAG